MVRTCHTQYDYTIETGHIVGRGAIVCNFRTATDRVQTEEKIHRSLQEKEILLKEVHHRVRNNMQMISSLLNQTKDPALVDMVRYTKKLIDVIQQSFMAKTKLIAIAPKIANISLNMDTAIPCGLIINELVTNALKHAFAGRTKGRITISIACRDSMHAVLTVRDDGTGLPKGFSAAQQTSSGLTLVQILVEQLNERWRSAGSRERHSP